jgi:hypothetical protein
MFRIFLLTFLGLTSGFTYSADHEKEIRKSALGGKFKINGNTAFFREVSGAEYKTTSDIVQSGGYFSYLISRVVDNAPGSFVLVHYRGNLPGLVPDDDLSIVKYKVTYLGIVSDILDFSSLPVVISDANGEYRYKK